MKKISKSILVLMFVIGLSTLTLAANYEVDSPNIGCKTIMKEEYIQIPINYSAPFNTNWLLCRKVSLVFQAPVEGFYTFNCKIKDIKYNREFVMPQKVKFCRAPGENIFEEFEYITTGIINLAHPELNEYTDRILIVESWYKN